MRLEKLKVNLHKAINGCEDKELLQIIYDILIDREISKPGDLYNSLSEEQKKELHKSYKESFDPKNLISNEVVFNKYK